MKLTKLMLLLFVIGAIFSCKKSGDQVSINGQLTGKEPGFLVNKDLTIETRTIAEDSLRTDSLRNYYLGAINDPIFALTQANVYSQLSLLQLGKVVDNTSTLDSVVFTLVLSDEGYFYGNANTNFTFDIFEITTDLGEDIRHYSKDDVPYNTTPIGTFTGPINYTDSTLIRSLDGTKKITPSLSIKLSNDFATKLFNATENELSSTDNFRVFLKGLAIVPRTSGLGTGDGGIFAVNMDHPSSLLTMYYDGTKQVDYLINNDECEIFSTFEASNKPAEIQTQISTAGNYDKGFVRGPGDTKVHVTFPNLFDLMNDGDININKAVLKVKVLDGTTTTDFAPMPTLYIAQPHPDTKKSAVILDYALYLGKQSGEYNPIDSSYSFIITRHLQDILLSKKNGGTDENRGLYILNFANAFRITTGASTLDPLQQGRVVLDTREGNGINLEILYSKID